MSSTCLLKCTSCILRTPHEVCSLFSRYFNDDISAAFTPLAMGTDVPPYGCLPWVLQLLQFPNCILQDSLIGTAGSHACTGAQMSRREAASSIGIAYQGPSTTAIPLWLNCVGLAAACMACAVPLVAQPASMPYQSPAPP